MDTFSKVALGRTNAEKRCRVKQDSIWFAQFNRRTCFDNNDILSMFMSHCILGAKFLIVKNNQSYEQS